MRFVASEIHSPFSGHHRYLVSLQEGVTMERRTLVERPPAEPHRFLDTKRLEENVFPGPSGGRKST